MNTKAHIAAYLALVVVALVVAAVVWESFAPGRWFYCDDSVGFSFIPPFAHPNKSPNDRYLVAPGLVYSVWGSLVGAALVLPAFAIFGPSCIHRRQLHAPSLQ